MTSIRILSLALALGFASVQVSCSKDESKHEDGERNQTVDDLYAIVLGVEKDLSQGYLLRNVQPRELASFKDLLYEIKIATMRLKKNPHDAKALSSLYLASQEYDKLGVLEQDESQLAGLKQKLFETLDVLARLQGKTLDNIERVLLSKRFDTELAPFVAFTMDNKKGWFKTNHEDLHYAYASGSKLNTWLFTPTLDLTQVVNPSFNLEQAINNSGNSFADSIYFQVSENYAGGDPASATWDTLDVQRLPDGNGFGVIGSEDVSLKRYEGKKIVIAFHYDSRVATRYPIWQLNSFNLMGSGTLVSAPVALVGPGVSAPAVSVSVAATPAANASTPPTVTPATTAVAGSPAGNPNAAAVCNSNASASNIFSFQFSKKDLTGNFTTFDAGKMIFPTNASYAQVIRFSGHRSTGDNYVGSTWVVSKSIDLSGKKDACLSVSDHVFISTGALSAAQTEILISTDYAGDPAKATWKTVVYPGRKLQSGNNTKAELAPQANSILVKDVLGMDAGAITVALRYTSTLDLAPWWAVADMTVTAVPAE